MSWKYFSCSILILIPFLHICVSLSDSYLVGLGKADITGPIADINLMGYANPSQIAGGLHTRLYARAFIVADPIQSEHRVVFVNLDACMASQAVTFTLLSRLQQRYGPNLYTQHNVVLSGTHTHSGPAGYLQYLIYDITGLGFVPQTFDALVDGIERAIVRAHDALRPGRLTAATTELLDGNINRSPTAYAQNPEDEREMYRYDTDKDMISLVFHESYDDDHGDGDLDMGGIASTPAFGRDSVLGIFSWYPVHGTSMNNTNRLVNGDNKGTASQFLERSWIDRMMHDPSHSPVTMDRAIDVNRHGYHQHRQQQQQHNHDEKQMKTSSSFIAAFCQANVGDTSPNTLGPFCMDTGLPCDAVHSTCNGRVQQCIARGPGWPDHFESTRIIAMKQAETAQDILTAVVHDDDMYKKKSRRTTDRDSSKNNNIKIASVSGSIAYRHIYLDMRDIIVEHSPFTRSGRTCKPAMGFAFAAGTTDGPGAFDFTQSDTNGTAFWRLVRNFITKPSPEQERCHSPKPILLDVGEMHFPYEWVPYIVEIQILRIGQFVVLAVPGEFTTMAGRRLKRAVADVIQDAWGEDLVITIAGLSNTYSSYITTYEEYQVQRYEGGFTLYGPHTLDAYIQEFRKLARAMVEDDPHDLPDEGPRPPNLLPKQWSLVPGVVADGTPPGVRFGDPSIDVEDGKVFYPGEEVRVEFHSACPRNDIRAEGTFLTVERKKESVLDHDQQKKDWCPFISNLFKYLFGYLQYGDDSDDKNQQHFLGDKDDDDESDWVLVHTDTDWETKFEWQRHETLSTYSFATVVWNIPENAVPGRYRIRHFGEYKHFLGHVQSFQGSSGEFDVVDDTLSFKKESGPTAGSLGDAERKQRRKNNVFWSRAMRIFYLA